MRQKVALNGAMAADRRGGFRGYTDRARREVARQSLTRSEHGLGIAQETLN